MKAHRQAGIAAAALSVALAAAGPAAAQIQAIFPGLAAPSVSTQSFRAEALRTDAYDIAAARMALERSRDPAVQEYARNTIREHVRTTAALLPANYSLNVTGNVVSDVPGTLPGTSGTVAAGANTAASGLTGNSGSVVIDNDPQAPGRRVALDPAHQSLLDRLAPLSGGEFDRAYAQQQVGSNGRVITLYQNYTQSGDNATARTFATEALPALQNRLAGSERLMAHLGTR